MKGGGGSGEAPVTGPVLHHELVSAETSPGRWMYLLHGIYGAGRNWRTVARRLTARRPEWGAVLVDLRMHGESTGFEGPHTLSACVDDLRRLQRDTGREPAALLGHSFGGKVVLEALDRLRDGGSAESSGAPGGDAGEGERQAWIVDSTPSAREPAGSAVRMLDVVRGLPDQFETREEAADGIAGGGFPRPVARWMTTNLERTDGGFRWALDWAAMEELLEDFFEADLWPVVADPPPGWEIHVVKAENSAVLPDRACDRIRRAGRRNGRVRLHRLSGGHWLNAENPDAVVDLLAEELPR